MQILPIELLRLSSEPCLKIITVDAKIAGSRLPCPPQTRTLSKNKEDTAYFQHPLGHPSQQVNEERASSELMEKKKAVKGLFLCSSRVRDPCRTYISSFRVKKHTSNFVLHTQ